MTNFKPTFLLSWLLVSFTGFIAAQPPPPAAPSSGGQVVTIKQANSLRDLPASERFSSVMGRFSIALPKSIHGYSALTPKLIGMNASGEMFQWQLREGGVIVTYHDFHDPDFSVVTEKDFANYFAGVKKGMVEATNGNVKAERPLTLGTHRGYEYVFERNGAAGVARTFYVNKRSYTLMAFPAKNTDAEKLIEEAFDSFTMISATDANSDIAKRVLDSTPEPLPQEPVAAKEKSDAEDEGLKGSVKTVTEESEDLSGSWSTQGRHLSSVEEYNEKGNRTKRIAYDSNAKPFQITVYGYLEGARVSKSASIRYDEDPPLMALPPSPKPPAPRDTRYGYKYGYKYVGGRLSEKQLILNNGVNGMRYVYNYDGNTLEQLVYDEKGKLNMKWLSKLDDKGNEIETIYLDVLKIHGFDETYSITYDAFDGNGNWTKKTTSKMVTEDGMQVYKPWYVTYRTITFH